MNDFFRRFARSFAEVVGSAWAFAAGLLLIAVWLLTGPVFHFSDTWQLVMNTFTSIITFMMVFVIQNSQNRDAKAIHLKLDELLRAVDTARTNMVDLETRPDEELAEIHNEFLQMSQEQLEEIKDKVEDVHEEVQEHLEVHGDKDGAVAHGEMSGPRRNNSR